MFDKGRPYDLKDHIYIEGTKREMHFYPTTRLDGLVKREILLGKKVIEIYEGRDDRLVYRSATFGIDSKVFN